MADRTALGAIGYMLGGLTIIVAIMAGVVINDITSGRVDFDGRAIAAPMNDAR